MADKNPFSRPDAPILQFFAWAHLPPRLQDASRPFGDLAVCIVNALPANPERTVALRKLLEAKDAAVRSVCFVSVDSSRPLHPPVDP